ncbi:hypothetical protein SRHO_G00101950 [Serrasalmus rhombeus]
MSTGYRAEGSMWSVLRLFGALQSDGEGSPQARQLGVNCNLSKQKRRNAREIPLSRFLVSRLQPLRVGNYSQCSFSENSVFSRLDSQLQFGLTPSARAQRSCSRSAAHVLLCGSAVLGVPLICMFSEHITASK